MPPLVQSLFGRMAAGRQAAIIAVGVIVTAMVFGVSRWATQPDWVPLYADIPMENVKRMTDKLTEASIEYKLGTGGSSILVATSDVPVARVALASEGLVDAKRPGYELFDGPTWGMTDFTQKVNYRRALEGELERTITKMRDVKAAQVHLALEDEQLFKKGERPSKASVTLTMQDGQRPSDATVHGIAGLVAGSVGGLEAEHVVVVDERGQALTMEGDASMSGLSNRQLAVQREVETYLEQKASSILGSLVGAGNARVQVSASINFDKIERTTQAVDPDKQAMSTEQLSEVTPSTPAQGAAYSTTAKSYENSRSVENFTGAIGNLKKLTVAVLIADKVTTPDAPADAKVLPAPVVTVRTPEEITRIEMLMRTALGVDSTRGDMISVVSAPFDIPMAPALPDSLPTPDMMTRLQSNPKPLVAIASLIVLLVLAMVLVSALKPKKVAKAAEPDALPAGTPLQQLPASSEMQQALQQARENAQMQAELDELQAQAEERRVILLPPTPSSPERDQAIATVDQRPDAAVRVVKNWIRS